MSIKKQTLVILSPAFAPNEQEEVLVPQENFIRSINVNYPELEVIIISFHFPVSNKKQYYWHNNKVIPLNGRMKGKLQSILLWCRAWRCLQVLKREHKLIGIFSFFCSESAFIGHYFSVFYNLKHFIWVLGQDAKAENNQVKRIRPKPDELIVISDFLQQKFTEAHGIKPKYIIPIGIDPSLYRETTKERTVDIVGAGSLIKLKQYDVFLEVVAAVANDVPKLTVRILGNGPEETVLKDFALKAGLNSIVIFEGKRNHKEVIAAMQECKVFLHTSSYEGFGMVCIEALNAGAHVVSFCKPMNQEIAHWHIVTTKEEMIIKVKEILQSSQIEYKPVLTFDINDSVKKLVELYDYNV